MFCFFFFFFWCEVAAFVVQILLSMKVCFSLCLIICFGNLLLTVLLRAHRMYQLINEWNCSHFIGHGGRFSVSVKPCKYYAL
uniref:Secreted protein n=1 Tax=Rhipicephalus microplus TaxID=6941 RepID=A0A6M2DA80_RHIMP